VNKLPPNEVSVFHPDLSTISNTRHPYFRVLPGIGSGSPGRYLRHSIDNCESFATSFTAVWKSLYLEVIVAGGAVDAKKSTGLIAMFQFDISRLPHCPKSIGSSGNIHNEANLRSKFTCNVVAIAQSAGPNRFHAFGIWISAGKNGFGQTRIFFRCWKSCRAVIRSDRLPLEFQTTREVDTLPDQRAPSLSNVRCRSLVSRASGSRTHSDTK